MFFKNSNPLSSMRMVPPWLKFQYWLWSLSGPPFYASKCIDFYVSYILFLILHCISNQENVELVWPKNWCLLYYSAWKPPWVRFLYEGELLFLCLQIHKIFFHSGFRMKLFQRWMLYCHVNVLQKIIDVKNCFSKKSTFVSCQRAQIDPNLNVKQ